MIAAFNMPHEPECGVLAAPSDVGAVHLTLLRPDGNKADVTPNKVVIGSPGGLPIVVAAMNDLMGLAITEGIEDALSVHMATGLGAWAAGSAPFLPKLVGAVENLAATSEYDSSPDCITILVDDDGAGRLHGYALATDLIVLAAKLDGPSAKLPHFDVLVREAGQ
jgi:hypothetical protein